MKTYNKPEIDIIVFTTESITDVSMGTGDGEGNDDI